MKGYLLDTNLLIALLWPRHQSHATAVAWFTEHRSQGWATHPLTEAGFTRIVSNPSFSRDAVTPTEATQVLTANTTASDHQFWPGDRPFAEVVAFAGRRLIGHQQVTDAYLLGLAMGNGGVLATLDRRILALLGPEPEAQQYVEIVGS